MSCSSAAFALTVCYTQQIIFPNTKLKKTLINAPKTHSGYWFYSVSK